MGYGIIKIEGNKMTLLSFGEIVLTKYETHAMKLKKIFERTLGIIDEYHPDELAIEAPFFGKNVQSMLKLGRAQGVAMAAALYRDVPIFEYTPKKIKMSITGSGNASKEQVASMLQSLLKIEKTNFFQVMGVVFSMLGVIVIITQLSFLPNSMVRYGRLDSKSRATYYFR